jgi:hypothetical protein
MGAPTTPRLLLIFARHQQWSLHRESSQDFFVKPIDRSASVGRHKGGGLGHLAESRPLPVKGRVRVQDTAELAAQIAVFEAQLLDNSQSILKPGLGTLPIPNGFASLHLYLTIPVSL